MSESDDSDILADIQALDEALALTAKKNSRQYASSSQQSDISSDIESEDNDDYINYLYTNQNIDESLNAYEINTRLITGLTIAKKKLTALLEECNQKIKLLDEKIMKSRENESSLGSKLTISNAGMPYFKDKNLFSAPKNHDTKLKEARGELLLLSLKKPSRWTGKDRETLLSAINNQAIESVLSGEFSKTIDESTSDNPHKKTELVLPRNFNEMVGTVGEKEFDWHKISVIDFDTKHSPCECQAMWNVYLHPSFRKSEWTNKEDNKLLRYAKAYKYQDWDAITEKLGTNRSAYQCFIRYNTIKKMPSTGRPWTKQEDNQLLKIINALKIGDYIPWTEIANHMRHRTKQQVYIRWTYRKAPHLRKGRFTNLESSTLMKAVHKYGTDFCKISSAVMPYRTSIQLQQHYNTMMEKVSNDPLNLWTINNDMTLINLYTKYHNNPNNWSKIATHFSNKTRTQVRHRYNALLRYAMKGVSLEHIPRPNSIPKKRALIKKKLSNKKLLKDYNKTMSCIKEVHHPINVFDIQLRLYETLYFPPLIKCNDSEDFEEEAYEIEQLAHDTKKLYDTLDLLNANLDIPYDFVNYVQLNNKEKQFLVSLKEYINARNNKIMNNELIEKFRTRMFGFTPQVSESDFFIPPLPFDGYVKPKKIKIQDNTSIDYDFLDVSENFLVDVPIDFSITSCTLPFISIEEEFQFHRLGQLLINDYHNYQQNIHLSESLKCILFFNKKSISNETSSENNTTLKISLEDEQVEQSNLKETISINEDDEEETNMNNIILPNQATLLGLKNLLLWKLLYDYKYESHQQYESLPSGNKQKSEQTATNSRLQTESAEYKLLRTRLLQLFKLPISLSNTIMQICGPETIFSIQERLTHQKIQNISKKRKFEDIKPVQPNKKSKSVVVINSIPQLNSDVTTRNLPAVRSCTIIDKKYKIVRK